MSVDALMTHEVTVYHQTGLDDSGSSIGEAERVFDTGTHTTMYLEPISSDEVEAERNTPVADWRGFGHANDTFESTDQIVYGSHRFDVIGAPRYEPNPRLGTLSHVEMDLKEVT